MNTKSAYLPANLRNEPSLFLNESAAIGQHMNVEYLNTNKKCQLLFYFTILPVSVQAKNAHLFRDFHFGRGRCGCAATSAAGGTTGASSLCIVVVRHSINNIASCEKKARQGKLNLRLRNYRTADSRFLGNIDNRYASGHSYVRQRTEPKLNILQVINFLPDILTLL